jgi:hypothetical protein
MPDEPLFSLDRGRQYALALIALQLGLLACVAYAAPRESPDEWFILAAMAGALLAHAPLLGAWAALGPGVRWLRLAEALYLTMLAGVIWGLITLGPMFEIAVLTIIQLVAVFVIGGALWLISALSRWALSQPEEGERQFSLFTLLKWIAALAILLALARWLPWRDLAESKPPWHIVLGGSLMYGSVLAVVTASFAGCAFQREKAESWVVAGSAMVLLTILVAWSVFLGGRHLDALGLLVLAYLGFAVNLGGTLLAIRSFGYYWQSR